MKFHLIIDSSTNDRNSSAEVNQLFEFPEGSVSSGADNVITVVQDNMGLDEACKHCSLYTCPSSS